MQSYKLNVHQTRRSLKKGFVKMMVNGTCINKTRKSVSGAFMNAWTGVSSLIAVIWLARSMYKQRQFSPPKFLSLAVCFCDLLFAGEYSAVMKNLINNIISHVSTHTLINLDQFLNTSISGPLQCFATLSFSERFTTE